MNLWSKFLSLEIRFLGLTCLSRDKAHNGSADTWTKITKKRWSEGKEKEDVSTEPPLIIGIPRSLEAYHNTMYN